MGQFLVQNNKASSNTKEAPIVMVRQVRKSDRIDSDSQSGSDQLGSSGTPTKYGHRDIEKIVLLTWKCNSHKSTLNLFLVDRAPTKSGKASQDETMRAIFFSIIY